MTDDAIKIDREHARICRRRDKAWGWAFAYFIPYCALFHIVTRKTLTPVFTGIVGIFAASLLANGYIDVVKGGDKTTDGRDVVVFLAIMTTIPGAVKAGIEWDRVRAEKELEGGK